MKDNQPEPSALITATADRVVACICLPDSVEPLGSTGSVKGDIVRILESFKLECARMPAISTRPSDLAVLLQVSREQAALLWRHQGNDSRAGDLLDACCDTIERLTTRLKIAADQPPHRVPIMITTEARNALNQFLWSDNECTRGEGYSAFILSAIKARQEPKVEDVELAGLIEEVRANRDFHVAHTVALIERLCCTIEQQVTAREEVERRVEAVMRPVLNRYGSRVDSAENELVYQQALAFLGQLADVEDEQQ